MHVFDLFSIYQDWVYVIITSSLWLRIARIRVTSSKGAHSSTIKIAIAKHHKVQIMGILCIAACSELLMSLS
jgi:hypothetical protein